MRQLHDLELEPEVQDWLDSLSDSDYKRAMSSAACSRKGNPARRTMVRPPAGRGLGTAGPASRCSDPGNVLVYC